MAVDSLFHKVLALIQGGSRANVAPALPVPTPPPLNPVYNAVITFSSNVTDGADHINLSDGVLTITPHAASMRKTVLEVGLHTAIEHNLTVEAVFELNLDVVAGAPIANILNTLEIRYAGSGLIDIHYHSTRRDLQYMSSYPYTPAKVTRYVGGGKLYLYARSKVRMDLYTSPPGGYGGSSTSYESQPVEFEIRSESGTVTTIPTAYPFTSDIGSNSFSGASSTNNWNAAPANELSVTTSYVRMGYLPKAANYPTTWRATSRDLVVYGDGGIGMTAVEKTDTGEVIRVLNSTTPVNGMTAYQALTVCAQAIAAQVPETPNILPGKVTTHDQPIYEVQNGMAVVIGYDRTVILSLPHSQVDSVWTLTVACDSTFQSRFQDAGMSSGVFCYGDGLPAIMNVTLSHTGALGVFGVAILDSNYGYWTVPVDQIPDIPPEQIAVYTVSDIDDAFGYIRDRLAQKGTITTAATNATTRVFTLTTSQYLDRYGGPLRHLKFFARKNLIAEGGISKLYGVRFTADERPKESSFPTLPWSTTSIPAGSGGGGSSDANTLLLLHLDEGSGATTDDASTYNSTVSVTNYASGAVAGKFSGGLNLATSQLTAPHDNRFDIGNTFTIEAFLNFPALPTQSYNILVSHAQSNSWTQGWVVFFDSSGGVGLYNNGSFVFSYGIVGPGQPANLNTWFHFAITADGTTLRIFVDGQVIYTQSTPALESVVQPLCIGHDAGNTYTSALFLIDELRISDVARYTANFTPPTAPFEIGGGPQPDVDVSLAGYNDIAFVSCEGSLTIQTSQPVAYFDSSTTVGDVTPTGAVFVVDSVSADFSGSSTLAAFTCSGSFVRSIPVEFDGTATLDDVTNDTGGFYSDVPKEMTGDSVLDDVECIAVLLFLTPMSFDANVLCDDVVSDGLMSLIEPVVYRLNSTVPAATIAANTTQFYVDATVPAATLSAEISQYEGFKLDVTVHAATGQGWFGMRLNSDVPRVALQAVGIVPNTLRLDAMLPWVTIQANASAGLLFSLSATVPIPSLSSWTGWQLQGDVAVASSSGFITTGGAYRLNAVVPMATLVASAVSENLLRLTAVVPAATRSGWVAVNKKVPAARLIGHIVPVVATTRVAYSFTLANSAMTRYPAYPFIQVLRMGNAYYGVGEDGLYELGGANDNGVAIPWSWETCMSDFGKAEKKTVVSAYLGGYVPQSMTYTIKVGDAPTGTNAHTTTATAVLRNHRQKFGIGRKSRFFAFGLSATQGQVAIESVEFEMASMSRRV